MTSHRDVTGMMVNICIYILYSIYIEYGEILTKNACLFFGDKKSMVQPCFVHDGSRLHHYRHIYRLQLGIRTLANVGGVKMILAFLGC